MGLLLLLLLPCLSLLVEHSFEVVNIPCGSGPPFAHSLGGADVAGDDDQRTHRVVAESLDALRGDDLLRRSQFHTKSVMVGGGVVIIVGGGGGGGSDDVIGGVVITVGGGGVIGVVVVIVGGGGGVIGGVDGGVDGSVVVCSDVASSVTAVIVEIVEAVHYHKFLFAEERRARVGSNLDPGVPGELWGRRNLRSFGIGGSVIRGFVAMWEWFVPTTELDFVSSFLSFCWMLQLSNRTKS